MSRSPISSSSNTQKIWRFVLFLLLASTFCLLFAWRHDVARREAVFQGPAGTTTVDIQAIESASIWDISSGSYTHIRRGMDQRKHLLILLTAADCGPCLLSLSDWVDLARLRSLDFEVDLLYFGTSEEELRQFEREHRLPYRSFYDKDGELAKRVALPEHTPVSILVDQNMRVLAAQEGSANSDLRSKYVAEVSGLL
jgi:Redoxin